MPFSRLRPRAPAPRGQIPPQVALGQESFPPVPYAHLPLGTFYGWPHKSVLCLISSPPKPFTLWKRIFISRLSPTPHLSGSLTGPPKGTWDALLCPASGFFFPPTMARMFQPAQGGSTDPLLRRLPPTASLPGQRGFALRAAVRVGTKALPCRHPYNPGERSRARLWLPGPHPSSHNGNLTSPKSCRRGLNETSESGYEERKVVSIDFYKNTQVSKY